MNTSPGLSEHPDGGEGWQDTMPGTCRMPDSCLTKKMFDSDPQHKAQGSTANSMARPGEARPVGNRRGRQRERERERERERKRERERERERVKKRACN